MKVLIISLCLIYYALGQKIAQKKCDEYAKAVYQEDQEIFSFLKRGRPRVISTCAMFENPLIVGGTPARVKEFPHMAAIGFAPVSGEKWDIDWLCGGSLISEQHVLTAAHCTVSQSGPPQKVRLGSINVKDNDDYIQEVKIDKFVNHPDYKRPAKYHDIAILFLDHRVRFTAFVRPACLNTVENIHFNKTQACGFGKTNYNQHETSQILIKVDLDLIPRDVCNKQIKFRKIEMPEKITEKQLCAGSLKGGRDTCQGDSGGPLQVVLEKPFCMYGIIGVTSFGRFCGMSNSPGIYIKVDQYISWIKSTIWQ